MPRRFSSNSSNDTSTSPSFSPSSGKGGISKATTVKSNRLSQFFSVSPKSKEQTPSGHSQPNTSPPISSASLSLPTISLSTATADSLNMDELPKTLFQPPTPE